MKFSRRANLTLFILLIVLNIILRYTISNHEIGSDSYEIHLLANSLIEFGEAKWWISPLSIIGMYPNSYASAMPFFLSGISLSTNKNIDSVIFLYGMIFGIFALFASYTLAGCIYDDDIFKFFVAFSFSTSQGILTYTTSTAPARSLFIVLLPLFLFALMKYKQKYLYFGLITAILTLLLLATHHLVFYLIPIFAGYSIVYFIHYSCKYIKFSSDKRLYPYILFFALVLTILFPFLTNKFIMGGSKWTVIQIMLNEYPRYFGIPSLLIIGGLISLIFKKDKRKEEFILVVIIILLTIFIFNPMYMKWFILIFFSLLAGYGFLNLIKQFKINKTYIKYIIVFIFILSITFSEYFQNLHEYIEISGTKRYIEHDEYLSSLWIKEHLKGNLISNDLWKIWHIAPNSGVPFIIDSAVNDQIHGFTDVKEYELNENAITSEEYWLNSPYYRVKGVTAHEIWKQIMEHSIYDESTSTLIKKFNFTYVVQNQNIQDYSAFSKHGYINSVFMKSIYVEKNSIYDDGDVNILSLI
ncbi:MAG: hypothetical protein Q7J35_03370 [Candidatus Methanoperedens sp.]|nr:hypothetical protein [Candidatus Methanoperedens sp.]